MNGIAGIMLAFIATFHPLVSSSGAGIAPELIGNLITLCAHGIDPTIQAAVVAVESHGNAWVLHDNNDGRVYRPSTMREAATVASTIIATNRETLGNDDRGIDIGLGQINSQNFNNLHVTVAQMLDPCENLTVSSHMLTEAWDAQRQRSSSLDPNTAWDAALQVYNSGRAHGDESYARVVRVAMRSSFVQRTIHHQLLIPAPAIIYNSNSEFLSNKAAAATSGSEFYAAQSTSMVWSS
jgi:type IV secretion system protein VirB1